jgi:hypothetical protein
VAQFITLTLESPTYLLPYGLLAFIKEIVEVGIRSDTGALKVNNLGLDLLPMAAGRWSVSFARVQML